MGPLRPRTTSVVSVTVFTAVSVVIALSLLATLASLVYLFLRLRSNAQATQGTATGDRSSSFANTIVPRYPRSDPIALQSYPQRAQGPPYPPHAPPPLPANATRPADSSPVRTASPNRDPVPPSASTSIEDFGHISPVSPIRHTVPTASSTNEATQRVASMLARLQAIPLTSDATDLSTDAGDADREVANPDFWAMLAQRNMPARDHALLGSDDSTDAGSRAGAALSYAARARGMEPRGASIDTEVNRGRFTDHCQGGRGRAVTMGREIADDGPGRLMPLQVRKMRSV